MSDRRENDVCYFDNFLGPLYFEPYALEIRQLVNPSRVSSALELAAGTGRVTCHLRDRIPARAKLIASDINRDMLSEAKTKLAHLDIDWQIIDAEYLPFKDGSFDLVVCCFGYMFVPDRAKAFAEAYRVLRPGGMLLLTTWDKLELNRLSFTARSLAEKYMQAPLPPSYNIAVSMNDEVMISSLFENAGFSKIAVEKVGRLSVCPTAREAAVGLVEGGFIFKEIRQDHPEWLEAIKRELENELAAKFGAAPMAAPMSAVIGRGWR